MNRDLFQENIAYKNDQGKTSWPHMNTRFTSHTWPLPGYVSLIYLMLYL